ncbi:IclR family transcriptional regulator [Microbacterium sp. zg.B48]|uniref:IclR family transcriptional regulator n=1 Tax=Microbacterium sp. zg.B48 TaxID=2969408 RepID=UPI00214B1452|nr:IclR family transcriptional regulator [Microbacterium sp. zg.B48]MCR2764315.1 IclR family transcriptional regulator [Microbacterium sp. zg.B48]
MSATPRVQSIDRGFAILQTIAGSTEGALGVSEITGLTGLSLPTTHRLLRTLVELGYARQLPSRRYALGPALIPLGESAKSRTSTWARPLLERLAVATAESANLAHLDGDMVVYLAHVQSRHQMRMFTEVGRRVYPHSTGVGKAILAQFPNAEVRAIIQRTGMPTFTGTTHARTADLMADLDVIRARGFAVDDGEQEVGVRCLAVAVPGGVRMAVSVSAPEARLPSTSIRQAVAALHEAADAVASETR